MCSAAKTPSLLAGVLKMKCPKCRRGDVFVNKHIFPLNKCLATHKYCPHCKHILQNESNNGIGINYALTVMVIFLNVLWYWPIFGLSYKDNSFYYFLGSSVLVALLLQPWLMRMSRVIYLYFFISFGLGSLPGEQ